MEDVKHEQLLVMTFSRAAAMEFRQRLYRLIENSAAYVEIKTSHSYCFDLFVTQIFDVTEASNKIDVSANLVRAVVNSCDKSKKKDKCTLSLLYYCCHNALIVLFIYIIIIFIFE